jgi:hypothetical protein
MSVALGVGCQLQRFFQAFLLKRRQDSQMATQLAHLRRVHGTNPRLYTLNTTISRCNHLSTATIEVVLNQRATTLLETNQH